MLRFDVYSKGSPAKTVDLAGAYAFGQDGIPVRAELTVEGNRITCVKRVPGACGLAAMWDVAGVGKFLLPTTRLPERAKPYNLNVEMTRAALTRLAQKREDWGLLDYADAEKLNLEFDAARLQFVQSLQADSPEEASVTADAALAAALALGEKMALYHAEVLLTRRKPASASIWAAGFGCQVDLMSTTEEYVTRVRDAFDFIKIPVPWKVTEPKEGTYNYSQIDAWVNWAVRQRKGIQAGPLVSFDNPRLPEWMYLWENDYESLRDQIYEHVQRIVTRYEKQVRMWTVVSAIHANNTFNLSFEQLMELTRMSCLLVKKLAPKAATLIELAMPWGEYYARNQRTIPPMLYADMAVQAGAKFDAFGLQIFMGAPVDGYFTRDLMQISAILDEFVGFGKPLHITAVGVPSDTAPDAWDAWNGKESAAKSGNWHGPWTQRLQAEWLQAFYRIAMSKPYVETVCWRDLADHEGHYMPHGGLCAANLEPKLAYKELRAFRSILATPVRHAKTING